MDFLVEWDREKAAQNLRKHGVSFEEAATVLADPLSVTLPDPDHSQEEQRSLLLGRSSSGRLLIVAHSEEGERIRIISARMMTPKERRSYERSLEF
ncbi:MAG: BrnT family toxin [Gemmatimonadetes bacterium]|nr:BrnT family toxin [Gemmatimonadota bacterium]